MEPAAQVAIGWAVFVVAHIGLASGPVRGALVRRLGESGFVWVFTAVASLLFIALVARFAHLHDIGARGLGLAVHPVLRAVLNAGVVVGIVMMTGAFAPRGYWSSPGAVLTDSVRTATGLERVTRHPFFSGTVLAMGAHALLARHLTGTVFFSGFVVLAIAGPVHQARKLRARLGAGYEGYLAETSAVPFGAILSGRQQLIWRELPWGTLGLGLAVAAGIYAGHYHIMRWHGAPLSASVVGGSILIGLIMSRRASAGAPPRPAPQRS